MGDMVAGNPQLTSAFNQRQIVTATTTTRRLPGASKIAVLSFLAILQAHTAIAQGGPAAENTKGALSRGSIYYLGSFSSARDLVPASGICGAFGLLGRPPVQLPEVAGGKADPSRCETVVNAIAGSRDFLPQDQLSSPYKVVSDSKGRLIVADRGAFPSVHIFDFNRRKHSRVKGGELQSPSGLAIDGRDQLYVADAHQGAILVYQANGKFRRYIAYRKGERLFERPAGIAIDPTSGHIFVTDPPRNSVVIVSAEGKLLATLGTNVGGSGPGEFFAPTDVVVRNGELFVLDSQNYRIQIFDLSGNFHASIRPASMQPSQSLFVDNLGRIYVVGPMDAIQVFQSDGRLLFQSGFTGTGFGQFSGPSGIWIDQQNRIYVADTGNHRVQSFEWGLDHGPKLPQP